MAIEWKRTGLVTWELRTEGYEFEIVHNEMTNRLWTGYLTSNGRFLYSTENRATSEEVIELLQRRINYIPDHPPIILSMKLQSNLAESLTRQSMKPYTVEKALEETREYPIYNPKFSNELPTSQQKAQAMELRKRVCAFIGTRVGEEAKMIESYRKMHDDVLLIEHDLGLSSEEAGYAPSAYVEEIINVIDDNIGGLLSSLSKALRCDEAWK